MPKPVKSIADIKVGDIFEDCSFHPCLCIVAGTNDSPAAVEGISLVDGSGPRCCSAIHCGLRILTIEEAIHWKFFGPRDQVLEATQCWWNTSGTAPK